MQPEQPDYGDVRGVIQIMGRGANGWFWPIARLDVAELRARGYDGLFMLGYTGQIDQLKVAPSACRCMTPQAPCPEHSTNLQTGGNPGRACDSEPVTVTVLFATGQEKGVFEAFMAGPAAAGVVGESRSSHGGAAVAERGGAPGAPAICEEARDAA